MFDFLLPRSTRRLIVYPAAIDTRWGSDRLRAACERELGIELDGAIAVLFYNRAKDTLVLYTPDADGDRCIKKKLVRGAFLVPVPAKGQKYVVVDASKISKLFQGPEETVAGRRDAKENEGNDTAADTRRDEREAGSAKATDGRRACRDDRGGDRGCLRPLRADFRFLHED